MYLSEFLTRETVQINIMVKDWREATELVGDLLVRSGGIENKYIDAMKRVKEEIGPYMVIAPGVVLLHARPEDGVIKASLGLITLETPVEFGHSENDPVDLVFALGAVDKDAHIAALQSLAKLLMDTDAVTALRKAETLDAFFEVFKAWCDVNEMEQ